MKSLRTNAQPPARRAGQEGSYHLPSSQPRPSPSGPEGCRPARRRSSVPAQSRRQAVKTAADVHSQPHPPSNLPTYSLSLLLNQAANQISFPGYGGCVAFYAMEMLGRIAVHKQKLLQLLSGFMTSQTFSRFLTSNSPTIN